MHLELRLTVSILQVAKSRIEGIVISFNFTAGVRIFCAPAGLAYETLRFGREATQKKVLNKYRVPVTPSSPVSPAHAPPRS